MKHVKNGSLMPKVHPEAAILKQAFNIQTSAVRVSSDEIEVQVETGAEISSTPKHRLEPRDAAAQHEPSWWFKGKRVLEE